MADATTLDRIATPLAGSDLGDLYEILDGRLVEKPPMGVSEVWIASTLHAILAQFAKEQRVGRATSEMLFALREAPRLQRRPDLAFVSYERWPKAEKVPSGSSWAVIPDLAVEVVSPTDLAVDLVTKIADFFRVGVRLVWVIFPEIEQVYVYKFDSLIRVVKRDGELDGGPVLPGFRLSVSELFEDVA